MAQTPDVYNGVKSWVEYSRPYFLQRIWTLPTDGAGILTNFVAVVLTLATALLFLICRHLIQLCWSESSGDTTQDEAGVASNSRVAAPELQNPNTEVPSGPPNVSSRDEDDIVDGLANHLEGTQSGTPITPANVPEEAGETIVTTNANGFQVQGNEPEGERNERTSLLPSSGSRRNQSQSKMDVLMSGETLQGVSLIYLESAWNEFKSGPETSVIDHLKLWLTWKRFIIRLGLSLGCLAVFVGFTIATIYVAQLASDGISLSASPDCGEWDLDASIDILSPFSYMQETESGDYARRCYNASAGADGCNFFFTQNIEYYEKNDTCPFASGFCLGDDLPAYTLSTGLVKSQEIGINVPIGYTFNRTSTCAPIQRDEYYSYTENNIIEYYYGQLASWMDNGNLTWAAFPNYPVWTGPGYNVETFCRVPANGPLGWQPILEFNPQSNAYISLMLIASQRNFHPERRSDPIFPAEELHLIGSDFRWTNNDLVATVLACTDHTSICTATGSACWDVSDDPIEEPRDQVEKDGLFMLKLALQKSSICHSILLRGGAALDASTKLFVYDSLPLAPEQWKVEAQNLFAASLARIQISLRDHVRGSAAKEPGYINKLPPEHAGMCRRYKFKSVGWTNVSVWGFIITMLGSSLVFMSAFRVKIPFPAADDQADGHRPEIAKTDRLAIEIFGIWNWRAGIALCAWVTHGYRWIREKSNEVVAWVRNLVNK